MMAPLIIAMIAAFSCGIERWLFYRKELRFTKLINQKDMNTIIQTTSPDSGLIPHLIHDLYQSRQAPKATREELAQFEILAARSIIEKRLSIVHTLGTLMPMLGLLGTVMGIISVFKSLSLSGGNPQLLSAGISQALITTETGLAGAIPALYGYSVLVNHANVLQNNLRMVASLMLQITPKDTEKNAHAL